MSKITDLGMAHGHHGVRKTIKLVQLVLDNSPSYSLGGVAPVTAMTGIKAISPFDPIAVRQSATPATLEEIQQIVVFRSRSCELHWSVCTSGWSKPTTTFALVMDTQGGRSKAPGWLNSNSLELSGDLLQHVAHNSEGHVVLKILRASYDAAAKCYKLTVRWRGLSEQEDSWEPVQVMLEDVPAVVKAFISAHADEEIVRQLADAHGLAIE
ncbi:hypothetical protein ON010_g12663 [Phytophthora cinnamomi]|nr:hypothetical protein ON010_g12663 [Phytophthora cinnamomi]